MNELQNLLTPGGAAPARGSKPREAVCRKEAPAWAGGPGTEVRMCAGSCVPSMCLRPGRGEGQEAELLGGCRERRQGLLSPACSYMAPAVQKLHTVLHGFPGGRRAASEKLRCLWAGPRKVNENNSNEVGGGGEGQRRPPGGGQGHRPGQRGFS